MIISEYSRNGDLMSRNVPSLAEAHQEAVAAVKAAAEARLEAYEGKVRQRADDRAAMGQGSELAALLTAKEAIRVRSNEIEAEILGITDPLAVCLFDISGAFDE